MTADFGDFRANGKIKSITAWQGGFWNMWDILWNIGTIGSHVDTWGSKL